MEEDNPPLAELAGAEGVAAPSSEPGAWQAILAALPDSLSSLFALGGPVTLVLALMSVLALAIILYKGVQLYTERSRGRRRIERAMRRWRQGDQDGALSELADSHRGVARLVRIAMQGRRSPDAPESLVREEVQRVAGADMQSLRSHLRTLEVIGTVSPLLGLFGTVLGMIEAFRQMEAAGAQVDPSVLSGGIWQALLTTGVGLAVAIPTVLAFQFLDRRAERHAHRIEDVVTQVFTARLHRLDPPMTEPPPLTRAPRRNPRAA